MSISVRRMIPADLEIAATIALAAFRRPQSHEPVLILRRYLQMQPDGWYLAFWNGEPVGMGGAIDFGPFATLGLMSVLPAMQKQGIGQALMEQLLSWLDARGCPTVFLNARSQAVSLYERSGFVTVEETHRYLFSPRPARSERLPGIYLLEKASLPAVAAFDAPAFGTSRLHVLSDFLDRDPQRFFVSKDLAGNLTGLLVAEAESVGPWHAVSSETADLLLQQALQLPYTGPFQVSLLASNVGARTIFARYGGQHSDTLPHMRRGRPLQRDQQQRLYGMASLMLC